MIDQQELKSMNDKWKKKLEFLKLKQQAEKKENNMVDSTGRTKTIDDFKGTEAHARYLAMCEQGAKGRKGSRVFGGTKGKFG